MACDVRGADICRAQRAGAECTLPIAVLTLTPLHDVRPAPPTSACDTRVLWATSKGPICKNVCNFCAHGVTETPIDHTTVKPRVLTACLEWPAGDASKRWLIANKFGLLKILCH